MLGLEWRQPKSPGKSSALTTIWAEPMEEVGPQVAGAQKPGKSSALTKIWAEPMRDFGLYAAAIQTAQEVVGLDEDIGRAHERFWASSGGSPNSTGSRRP